MAQHHPPPGVDPSITDYYEQAPEEERLGQGAFVLEELRTREIIERYAPRPPATVLDVGGAAGAYALPLANAGYTVHLVDASPRLVAEADRGAPAAGSGWPRVAWEMRGRWTSRMSARRSFSCWARSII